MGVKASRLFICDKKDEKNADISKTVSRHSVQTPVFNFKETFEETF